MMQKQILVLGCGVSGLSCGIRLLEEGFAVKIIARDLPPHTTSNVAATIWFPYKAYPFDKVLAWGKVAYQKFMTLMDNPATGVSMTTFIDLYDKPMPEDPWWKEAVDSFRHSTSEEHLNIYQDGYAAEVPLIDTPIYMTYLMETFQKLGGEIEQRAIHALDEFGETYPIIINCTGLGAKPLTNDEALYPIKGQIVRIEALDIGRGMADNEGPLATSYIIPRQNDCVLGGTTVILQKHW